MNIKSLLLGSAAALVAVSGARAADAIIAAEPEPVEYVRVCDAFGTGYFYIPGSETCLQISGFVRYELNLSDETDDWGKRSEIRLELTAKTETELGTLGSFIRLGYDQAPRTDAPLNVQRAYITLGGLTIGKKNTWWDWGFGEDGDGLVSYGPGDLGMIAYTYNAGATAITLALEEDESGNYTPDVVLDVTSAMGPVKFHGGVAYNESQDAFTAKAYVSTMVGAATVGVGVQWSDDTQLGSEYLAGHEWVFGADISAPLSEKLKARAGFNWGSDDGFGDDFVVGAGINYTVVSGFDIDARVNYTDSTDSVSGRIRFTRTFGY